jgi:hypothetical protein
MLDGELPEDPVKRRKRVRQMIMQSYRSRAGHLVAIHRMEELAELLGFRYRLKKRNIQLHDSIHSGSNSLSDVI